MEGRKKTHKTERRIVEKKAVPMYRNDAIRNGLVFHTHEMVDWLQKKIGAQHEMSEAVLGAWVGVLRYDALSRAEQDPDFLRRLEQSDFLLHLNKELAPAGWQNEELWTQISIETGLLHEAVRSLLQCVGQKLHELKTKKAFDPIGWFLLPKSGGFDVLYWRDFLRPLNDDPKELLWGNERPHA